MVDTGSKVLGIWFKLVGYVSLALSISFTLIAPLKFIPSVDTSIPPCALTFTFNKSTLASLFVVNQA